MDATTVESVVTGPLIWLGHTMFCRDCGHSDRWSLDIERPTDVDGELAWAICTSGHRRQHPLVYPQIVRRAAGWTRGPDHKVYEQQLNDWLPHWLSWRTSDSVLSGARAVPRYRSWEEPGPVRWDQEWPELVAASKVPAQIREWADHSDHTDLSFTWMMAWGTTDPDKRQITIIPVGAAV